MNPGSIFRSNHFAALSPALSALSLCLVWSPLVRARALSVPPAQSPPSAEPSAEPPAAEQQAPSAEPPTPDPPPGEAPQAPDQNSGTADADVAVAPPSNSPAEAPPAAPVIPPGGTPPFGDAAGAGPRDFSNETPFETLEADIILVTVDRRKKDIQKVSASVQAISGDELSRRGVTSVRELTAATPYLEVGAQEGNIELYMRGIGGNDNSENGDPAIAPHLDGVYIPRPRGFGAVFFDVERVELNLGPQGTLRGRNALGGSINVVTKAPKIGEWEAYASLQLGNYNQRLARGAINVPLGDEFALRIALFSESRDPFYQNKGGDPLLRAAEDADTWAYRISGRWLPTENMTVTLRLDNTKERGTGSVGSNYTDSLRFGIEPSEVPNPRAVGYVGHQPSQTLDHWGISSTVEVDFGPVGVEVLSSYRDLTYTQHTGANNGVFFYGINEGNLDRYADSNWRTTSQSHLNEIRLFAPDTDTFRWTAGFFHFYEKQTVFLGQVQEDPTYGWMGRESNYNDVPSGAMAGFVDVTADVTEVFRVLAGFRLTSEYKERHGIAGGFDLQCNVEALAEAQRSDPDATCLPPSDPSFESGLRWGTPGFQFKRDGRSDYSAGSNADTLAGVRDRVGTFLDGVETWGSRDEVAAFLAQPGADVGTGFIEQHGSVKTLFPDFRLGGEWDVSPSSMIYLTFTTGHKSGGFNDSIPVADEPPYVATFAPETLYATELGSKNELLNKKLVLNGAAFWYTYKDYQASSVQEFGAPRLANTVRANTGDARVLGLQGNAVGYFPRGLTGRVSAMLLDARFVGAEVADTRVSSNALEQPRTNLEGNFLPRAPQLALSYGISQNIPTVIGYFDWSLSGQTKSKMYMTQFNGEGYDLEGYANPLFNDVVPWTTRIDASVGYSRTEGDIRIDAFVANLTDMVYMTSLINVPNTNLRFFNTPRQVGVRMSLYL